jgi:ferredoxin-NADP reductase
MFHAGKIIRRFRTSPSVMMLDIDVPSLGSFRPGQWVDFVAKPNEWVGGFSIASSPRDLPKITLAVKNSNDPPATWIHDDDRSSVGLPVEIRVGGDCVLDERLPLRPSVFCAGGIGVSPILSQYREFIFLRDKTNPLSAAPAGSSSSPDANAGVETAATMFLYTVSSATELVFGSELAEISRQGSEQGHDRMVFALTKQTSKSSDVTSSTVPGAAENKEVLVLDGGVFPAHIECRGGRVLTEFLNEAPHGANYYICGPPSMIDDAVHHLTSVRAIPLERIKYEKWW